MATALQSPANQEGGGTDGIRLGERLQRRGGDARQLGPVGDRAGEGEGAELGEVIAILTRPGVGGSRFEHPAGHPQRQRNVASGPGLHVQIAEGGGAMMHGVDRDQLGAPPPGLEQHWQQVHVRDVQVLAPQHNAATVEQIEEIVAVFLAKVGGLGGVPRPGADVARLARDRTKAFEEVVDHPLENPHRSAAAVIQDGGGTRLGANAEQAGGDVIKGGGPGDWLEVVPHAAEGAGETPRVVLVFQEPAGALAEKTLRDGVVLVPLQACDAAILDGGHNATGVRAVAIAGSELLLDDGKRHGDECPGNWVGLGGFVRARSLALKAPRLESQSHWPAAAASQPRGTSLCSVRPPPPDNSRATPGR